MKSNDQSAYIQTYQTNISKWFGSNENESPLYLHNLVFFIWHVYTFECLYCWDLTIDWNEIFVEIDHFSHIVT